jgi:hypothetical protein
MDPSFRPPIGAPAGILFSSRLFGAKEKFPHAIHGAAIAYDRGRAAERSVLDCRTPHGVARPE